MTARRFPLPWSVEDNGACFIVKDGAGQKLTDVYTSAINSPAASKYRHRGCIRAVMTSTLPAAKLSTNGRNFKGKDGSTDGIGTQA
jgi:hypothetical protein